MMKLLPNSPIQMDYSPATDILTVEYPDLDSALLPMVTESLMVMAEAINDYDIKLLLLDASFTKITISELESRDLSLSLATELAKTRLEKVARVQPLNQERERQAQETIAKIRQSLTLPYQLQTFSSKTGAIQWLQESK